jgi:hypothetical protein
LTGGASGNRLDAQNFSGTLALNGGGGNDTLIGGSGDNELDGGDGDDILIAGDDRFARPGLGSQANVLLGGGGTNLLRGGVGRDTFHADLSGTATLIGGGDDDTFIITNSSGTVVAPVGGITIDGGGQSGDTLRLVGGGGPSYNQTYLVGPSADEGQIVTTNNHNPTGPTISQFIRFTGLAAIDDSVTADKLSVMGASALAPIAGASAVDLASGRIRLTVGGSPFAVITFANKAKPSVLLAGGQVVTAAAPAVAAPLAAPLAVTVSTPTVAAAPPATATASATAATVTPNQGLPNPASTVVARRFGAAKRPVGHPWAHSRKATPAGQRSANHLPKGPLRFKAALKVVQSVTPLTPRVIRSRSVRA